MVSQLSVSSRGLCHHAACIAAIAVTATRSSSSEEPRTHLPFRAGTQVFEEEK